MKQSLRHQKIVELVKQKGYLSTEELVALFGVSPQTIRRDLNELAETNFIRRHRKHFFSQEKNRIARQVVQLIPNGASLFIDIGTTSEAVSFALLGHQRLRIVTNNLNAAHILMQNDSFDITIASGSLRQDGGIIGESTVEFLSQFRLDFGVLGISAIDLDGTLLDYDYHEVQVKRAIIDNSRNTLLVTDHSKFSRRAMVKLGSITDVEYVFTDADVPSGIDELLKNKNVNLVIC